MGFFKEILERSIADRNKVFIKGTQSEKVYKKYQNKFGCMIGEPVIWRTKNNINLRAPQLVVIERVEHRYVVVVKTSYNVEGFENKIRYAVMYNALFCGVDTFETLKFK